MRARLRRLPRALWACTAIAVINAFAWAVFTPAFQVPDEPVHAGYAQIIAETGKLPVQTPDWRSSLEVDRALRGVPWSLEGDPTWIVPRAEQVERGLEQPVDRTSPTGAGYVAGNPPLYYALMAVPYRLAYSGTLLDRLMVMRWASALLAGLLAIFVFLFLREAMPRHPVGWSVGTLGVVLHPVVGFMAGGVSPDLLLWTCCAAALWLLARAFHRGLTPRLGVALGAATAAGMLTKLAMLTFLPGLVVGLALVVVKQYRGADRALRRPALAGAAAAVGVVVASSLAWRLISELAFDQPVAEGALATSAPRGLDLREGFSYVWQFYLPRLGFMVEQFPGYPPYPLWDTYVRGFVGRFGWFQYDFPTATVQAGLVILCGLALAALVTLALRRGEVRERRLELVAYAVIAAALALMVNVAGYRYRENTGFNFEQTRYLFPLLPLYGAILALAIRAAGRRLAPVAAALLVGLIVAHDLIGLLLSLWRYYI